MKKYFPYITILAVVALHSIYRLMPSVKDLPKSSANLNLQVIPMMEIIMLPFLQKGKKRNCIKHFIRARNTVSLFAALKYYLPLNTR